MLGRCWVDFGSNVSRFGVDSGSVEGLRRLLGDLEVAMGAQNRITIDFWSILKSVLGPKPTPIDKTNDAEIRSNYASIWDRYLIDL